VRVAHAPRVRRSSPTLACMKITATRLTALLAGGWTGVGALGFETWVRHTGERSWLLPLVFFVGAIPFFFIPMFVFVFGSAQRSGGSLIHGMLQAWVRGLCWFAGASLVLFPGLAVISRLYAS
jgi:hypothetical protein